MILFSALPPGGPHIQGVQQDVKIGDIVSVNCTSLKSKPAADLTFFINGRNVSNFRFPVRINVLYDWESLFAGLRDAKSEAGQISNCQRGATTSPRIVNSVNDI